MNDEDLALVLVQRLIERLDAAERVCLLYGWTGNTNNLVATDKEEALMQAWMEWRRVVPDGFLDPVQHPGLSDEAIRELAEKRRHNRKLTLEIIRGKEARIGSSIDYKGELRNR